MKNQLVCFLNRFLTTDDLDDLAKNDILKKYFIGTYPADIIPYAEKKPCCWIWNIDKENDEGKHWIAIWIEDNEMIFFDSYGFNIKEYKRTNIWNNFAKENNLNIKYYHHNFYQNVLTKTCGTWSLIFLYQKCFNKTNKSKKDFFDIFNSFPKHEITKTLKNKKLSEETMKNDINLFSLAKSIFKKNIINIYTKKCKTSKHNQMCKNFISFNKN